jgi:hypothetical protein
VTLSDLRQGVLVPPPLGTASDGLPCPTTLDFFVSDQDPSDNVVTTYLIVKATGLVAVNSTANLRTLGAANVIFAVNPSDERLVNSINVAIGCKGWHVRDMQDPENFAGITSLATNELFAAHWAPKLGWTPPGYIPLNDPMARVGNQPSLPKVNLYRVGVAHPLAASIADADVTSFCMNMYIYQPYRLLRNLNPLYNAPSPDERVATSLLAFLARRFVGAFGADNLGCTDLLGVEQPINLTVNGNGQVTGATILPFIDPKVTIPIQPPYVRAAASSLQLNIFFLFCLLVAAFRM